MKKIIYMKKLSFIIAILSVTFVNAQFSVNTSTNNENRWTFGGYAGLRGAFVGNVNTSLYITPRAGYKLTDNIETGLSSNFTWNNFKYYSSTMVGLGPFLNYYFGRTAYVSANYQHYFIKRNYKPTDEKINNDEAALYIGGGYMQRIGANTYMQIGGMYNVLYKENSSVFGGAFVPNAGIVFGL